MPVSVETQPIAWGVMVVVLIVGSLLRRNE